MAQTQSKLILYLIILLGLVGGYLYNAEFDPAEAVPEFPAEINVAELTRFSTFRINYGVLQNPEFDDLRIFGEFPVPTVAPGKNNPFQ